MKTFRIYMNRQEINLNLDENHLEEAICNLLWTVMTGKTPDWRDMEDDGDLVVRMDRDNDQELEELRMISSICLANEGNNLTVQELEPEESD